MSNELPLYGVRARNTAPDSENRIHDDDTAARYGFRGGLVPGVTVYGYMTVPAVTHFGRAWLESGAMQMKFIQPVYEGDDIIIRTLVDDSSANLAITAERDDGTVCAVATATLDGQRPSPHLDDYLYAPLPENDARPDAVRESFVIGATLGILRETLNSQDGRRLNQLDEQLPIYRGASPPAHPVTLLEMCNHLLMRNFKLGPWIHTASDLVNYSTAHDGEMIEVRGRIADCYERKGHEFVVLDVLLVTDAARPIQQVRHTAIYRPRFV